MKTDNNITDKAISDLIKGGQEISSPMHINSIIMQRVKIANVYRIRRRERLIIVGLSLLAAAIIISTVYLLKYYGLTMDIDPAAYFEKISIDSEKFTFRNGYFYISIAAIGLTLLFIDTWARKVYTARHK